MLQNYLPLQHEDLVLWDSDPEQYGEFFSNRVSLTVEYATEHIVSVCEEVGDSWKYNYRPCCESLFLTLFHEFRETLAPFLIDQLRQCDDKTSTQDLAGKLSRIKFQLKQVKPRFTTNSRAKRLKNLISLNF